MTEGTIIFWKAFQNVITTPADVLSEVKVSVVKEPGKARTVTKGKASLKVILNAVNQICSSCLKKAISSSASGMSSANHLWNFFKDIYRDKQIFDHVFKTVRNLPNFSKNEKGPCKMEQGLDPLYAASTDYSTATDYLSHQIADIIGTQWMVRCGIPPILREVVRKTCYKPRKLFYTGLNIETGVSSAKEDLHMIMMKRGVLMGDPLTKPILHFVNI